MPDIEPVDRLALREGFERNRAAFHELLNGATPADLKGLTDGTKWTNEQLLFHMLFGYLLVRALLQHFDHHQKQLTLPDTR